MEPSSPWTPVSLWPFTPLLRSGGERPDHLHEVQKKTLSIPLAKRGIESGKALGGSRGTFVPLGKLKVLQQEERKDKDEEGEGLQDTDCGEAFAVEGWLLEGGLDAGSSDLALEDGREHDGDT